jgi:hypothetical protein
MVRGSQTQRIKSQIPHETHQVIIKYLVTLDDFSGTSLELLVLQRQEHKENEGRKRKIGDEHVI